MHEGSNEPIKQTYFDNFMMSFQTIMMDAVASSMDDGHKNFLPRLRTHCNGILNRMVSKTQSKTHANLISNADNNNGESNKIKEPNNHTFFDSSMENVEESETNCYSI